MSPVVYDTCKLPNQCIYLFLAYSTDAVKVSEQIALNDGNKNEKQVLLLERRKEWKSKQLKM